MSRAYTVMVNGKEVTFGGGRSREEQCCPECGGSCSPANCWQRRRTRADAHEGHRGDEE